MRLPQDQNPPKALAPKTSRDRTRLAPRPQQKRVMILMAVYLVQGVAPTLARDFSSRTPLQLYQL